MKELFEGVGTEFELAEVFGSGLKAILGSGAGAAVLAGMIVFLEPSGEGGVEGGEAVDAFFGEGEGGFEP